MKTMLVLVGVLLAVLMVITAGAPDLNEQAAAKAGYEQQIQVKEEQLKAALDRAVRAEIAQKGLQDQLAVVNGKYAEMEKLVQYMNGEMVGLQDELAAAQKQLAVAQTQPGIPVTGPEAQQPAQICLVTRTAVEQIGSSLWVVMVGVVALGGGGWVAYRSGDRKVTVRMTRSQLKEYLRYQREGGNRAG